MGFFLFPVLAFVLWELPSMVAMAVHKLICALTGHSFEQRFLGVWAYRLLGMLTFWPLIMVTGGVAAGTGPSAAFGRLVLIIEATATVVLLLWARLSSRGA